MPKWRECWCISLRWGKTLKGPAWQMILETFFLCLRIEILFFVELPLLILFRNFLDFPLDIRISLRPLFNFFYSFQSTNYFYNKSMLKLIHLVVSVASIWTCGFLIMSITTEPLAYIMFIYLFVLSFLFIVHCQFFFQANIWSLKSGYLD